MHIEANCVFRSTRLIALSGEIGPLLFKESSYLYVTPHLYLRCISPSETAVSHLYPNFVTYIHSKPLQVSYTTTLRYVDSLSPQCAPKLQSCSPSVGTSPVAAKQAALLKKHATRIGMERNASAVGWPKMSRRVDTTARRPGRKRIGKVALCARHAGRMRN